jgi:hypothetical protein
MASTQETTSFHHRRHAREMDLRTWSLISLARYRKYLEGDQVRLEVSFDTSQGTAKGGRAEISIGFVDL